MIINKRSAKITIRVFACNTPINTYGGIGATLRNEDNGCFQETEVSGGHRLPEVELCFAICISG